MAHKLGGVHAGVPLCIMRLGASVWHSTASCVRRELLSAKLVR